MTMLKKIKTMIIFVYYNPQNYRNSFFTDNFELPLQCTTELNSTCYVILCDIIIRFSISISLLATAITHAHGLCVPNLQIGRYLLKHHVTKAVQQYWTKEYTFENKGHDEYHPFCLPLLTPINKTRFWFVNFISQTNQDIILYCI